jgi:hypothetical protein
MKIELRKIKFGPTGQETMNYKADLYVDGVLVGYCTNGGSGGMTRIHGQSAYGDSIIRKAEKWANELPKKKVMDMEVSQSLDSIVDEIAYRFHVQQKIQRHEVNNIVYGNPETGELSSVGWKGMSIASMKTTEDRRRALQQAIDTILDSLKEGEFICNGNLSEFLPQPEVS